MGHYFRENLGALSFQASNNFQAGGSTSSGSTGSSFTKKTIASGMNLTSKTPSSVQIQKGTSAWKNRILTQLNALNISVEHRNWVITKLKSDYGSLENSPYPISSAYVSSAIAMAKEIDKPNLIRKHLVGKGLTTQEIIWVEAGLIADYGSLIASPYPPSGAYVRTKIAGAKAKIAATTAAQEAVALAEGLDQGADAYQDERYETMREGQKLSYQQAGKKPLGLIFAGVGVIGLGVLTFVKMRKRKR